MRALKRLKDEYNLNFIDQYDLEDEEERVEVLNQLHEIKTLINEAERELENDY